MISKVKFIAELSVCLGLIIACSSQTELQWNEKEGYRWAEVSPGYFGSTGFTKRDRSDTHISFRNHLSKERIAENRNLLNGSGVAAGDMDGDGLTDLYFAQLEGPNKLYKNMGAFQFRDITEASGVAHKGFNSLGAVFADIDGDSDLDLLVTSLRKKNTLYINDGSGHFEIRRNSGLGESKGSTTMALADIDRDNDLDLYITNYKERSVRDIYSTEKITQKDIVKKAGDEYKVIPPFDEHYTIVRTANDRYLNEYGKMDDLYINNGDGTFEKAENLQHRFRDSDGNEKGLSHDWGLAAKFQDINGDRLPDLYVCNDFWTPDRIWINQGDGIFKAMDRVAIRNLSFSSMAVDFSDINRDGALDFFITEMLSSKHQRRMRQMSEHLGAINGRPQYNRNSLYLNWGDNTFAEIALFSDVEATGWSWATNFLDIDLDGYEDLMVTTGNAYDVQNLDTQLQMAGQERSGGPLKGAILNHPSLPLSNRIFRNNRDMTFADRSSDWGFTEADVSHGMALADLDNDGDLDFAVNRLNQVADIYENTTTAPRIAVRLKGEEPNTQGIGTKIELHGGPVVQEKEVVSGGNYISGSDPLIVFAADEDNKNHRLVVTWPDGSQSKIDSVQANRIYQIDESETAILINTSIDSTENNNKVVFEDVSDRISHTHYENNFQDFRVQPLLPLKLSRQGPGIGWIDYDQDGDDDLFIATGKGGKLGLFENQGQGQFKPARLAELSRQAPGDQTTILGWAEGNHTNIIVGSENYEQGNARAPSAFQYLISQNRPVQKDSLQGIHSNTGALAAADYDEDGDVDLFIGGRFKPLSYPENASSRLFKNENGHFVLDQVNSRKLSEIGLVTGAVFSDYDQDGDQDLLISREWDSILLYENKEGNFQNVSSEVGLDIYQGWWNGIATGDFNSDGRLDIVATNIGLNSTYQLGSEFPLKMYYDDFDGNGRLDILEAYYHPASSSYVPRRKLYEFDSLPIVLRYVQSHKEYANSSVGEIFRRDFSKVPSKEINTLRHMLFLNNGEGYSAQPLPAEAQFSAAFYAGVGDVDNDGNEDLFLSQNLFVLPPNRPRLDAGRGLWLRGDGQGNFDAIPGQVSGIKVYGEQRGAALSDFNGDGKVDLAVSQNGSATKLYLNRGSRPGLSIRLVGPNSNKDAIGSGMRLVYKDGSKGPRREIQAGSGYWSQNSTVQVLGFKEEPVGIELIWFDGTIQEIDVSKDKEEYVISY